MEGNGSEEAPNRRCPINKDRDYSVKVLAKVDRMSAVEVVGSFFADHAVDAQNGMVD